MKTLLTLTLCLTLSSLIAQQNGMFITMSGGANTHKDVILLTNIGYQYNEASAEIGITVAPLQNDRPAYFHASLTYNFYLNDNWKITPVLGAALKYFTAEKYSDNGYKYCVGARLQWTDYFIQSNYMDKQVFISIGFKGFWKEKY